MRPISLTFRGDHQPLAVTLVDCPDFLPYDAAADQLYSGYPKTVEGTDVLIVRAPVDRSLESLDSARPDLERFANRFPRASVHLLATINFQPAISGNCNFNASALHPEVTSPEFLKWLRTAELRRYISHSPAILPSRENFIYRTPNERYVKNFLRVGSIQLSRGTLDSVFFWLLPHLRDCGAILCETWSVSSIALNAARLLERYSPTPGKRCRVDMLSMYHDASSLQSHDLQECVSRLRHTTGKVLVLFSAVLTGRSLRNLKSSLAETSLGAFSDFVTIYKLAPDVEVSSLCDLYGDADDPDFSSYIDPPAGRAVVRIDPRTYFPLRVEERALNIRKKHTTPNRAFFDRYAGGSVIAAHRNSTDVNNLPFRHHGIFIDVEAMLETSEFRDALFSAWHSTKCKPPSIIVTPPHSAGLRLAAELRAEIRRSSGAMPHLIRHVDLDKARQDTPADVIGNLTSGDVILVVDDVSVTGQRLRRYQRNLRELEFEGKIVFLIGVARPESLTEWERRTADLQYRDGFSGENSHQVVAAEMVILPDWNRYTCPWCAEIKHLTMLFESLPGECSELKLVVERLRILQTASDRGGLVNDLFWCVGGDRPSLTKNSIFLGAYRKASEADVMASVAASLQQMRSSDSAAERLEANYPVSTVLDSGDYLGTRFSDLVLQLAIMRGAYRPELMRWDDRREQWRRQRGQDMLLEDQTRHVELELMVQLLSGKLPPPSMDHADRHRLAQEPAGRLLLAALDSLRGATTPS